MKAADLIAANIAAHTVHGYSAWHMVCLAHERTIRTLMAELDTLRGTNATPGRNCKLFSFKLGAADVLVEGEYEPAEGDGWDAPHYPACWSVSGALLNGSWVGPEGIPEAYRIAWENQMEAEMQDEREAA